MEVHSIELPLPGNHVSLVLTDDGGDEGGPVVQGGLQGRNSQVLVELLIHHVVQPQELGDLALTVEVAVSNLQLKFLDDFVLVF